MFMVPYHQKGHFKGNRDVSLCLPTQKIFLQINVSYLLQIRFQGNLFLEHPTTASAGTKRWDLLSSLATSHCWHPCFGVGTRIAFWPSQTVGLSARHFLLPICFGMAWHGTARHTIGWHCVCMSTCSYLLTYTNHIYSYILIYIMSPCLSLVDILHGIACVQMPHG